MEIILKTVSPQEAFAIAFASLKETPDVETFVACCMSPKEGHLPPITLLFPRFREDSPDLEGFTEWLWLNAINYVIPLRKRKRAHAATAASGTGGDLSISSRLVAETRRAFISYKEAHPNRASEVGELLAYLIAVHYLNAPQIASKMALKTNSNMPVHGLDGVHASFSNDLMTLYFLESKLAKTATSGISDYAESVAGFGTNRKQYLVEYEIISDLGNLGALSESDRAIALEYLDVYGSKRAQRIERSIGVICYSESKLYENKLPKHKTTPPLEHEKAFSDKYEMEYVHHLASVAKHLIKNGVDPTDCEVFFVAVPDVGELRKLFAENMK